MIERLIEIDQNLFLFLNGLGSTNYDPLMVALSSHWMWIPVYVAAAVIFIRKSKLKGFINLGLLFITLLITDQVSVHLFKEIFERLRPCHDPGIMEQVRLVADNCGGQFGFVSSHATNSFGLAMVSAGLIQKRFYTIFIIIWALLVSYSRIYIGVHYPGDMLGGLLLGIFLGWLVLTLTELIKKKITENAQSKKT